MPAAFSFAPLTRPALSALVLVALAGSSPALAAPSDACSSVNVLAGKEPIEVVNVTGETTRVTDGAVAAEGAAWDAPAAITSRGIGGVTFDLGEPKPMSVAYLQGDANDTYLLTGSVEGKPGTFHVLGEFAKVGERGAGLRGRTLRFPTENLRFLRIRSGHGDEEFAIAELAVYCAEPTPFPPAFRVEATNVAPAPAGPRSTPGPGEALNKYLVAAAVTVGLAFWALRSKLRGKIAASGRNAQR
jgi:hypothetical protein